MHFVQACLEKHVIPTEGRKLHVEIVDAAMDFQKLFADLKLDIHGLASTAQESRVNHCWRVVRRALVDKHSHSKDWTIDVHCDANEAIWKNK